MGVGQFCSNIKAPSVLENHFAWGVDVGLSCSVVILRLLMSVTMRGGDWVFGSSAVPLRPLLPLTIAVCRGKVLERVVCFHTVDML